MTHKWTQEAGSAAAKAFIAQNPTPRALRAAIDTQGWDIITPDIQAIAWNESMTIGQVLRSEAGVSRYDLTTLHALVAAAAQDAEVWQAPDGTITRRTL